jgi:hypothetical protein
LPAADAQPAPGSHLWKSEDGFSFRDLVDTINPLQHLPIIGTIYRAMTGDTIGTAPRLVGGTLFGGPIGFVTSLFNAIVENDTGKDVGAHVVALLDDSKDKSGLAAKPETPRPALPPRANHGDEQLSPVPAWLPPGWPNQPADTAAQPQRQAQNFPTANHGDERLNPEPAWLPERSQAAAAPVTPSAQVSAVQGPPPPMPLNYHFAAQPAQPGQMPNWAGAARALQQAPQSHNRMPASASPTSQGTVQTFAGGGPGAGIKGMPLPLPSAPPGWNAAVTPAIQAQQLPVAASPQQVPGAMQQALDKYDQMLKTRKPQGQQVSVLN